MNIHALASAGIKLAGLAAVSVGTVAIIELVPAAWLIYGCLAFLIAVAFYFLYSAECDRLESLKRLREINRD